MPKTRQIEITQDEPNEFGHGMLHKAVIHNNVRYFKILLKNGHDINTQDELGFSPLHLAAMLGRNEIIDEMIKIKDEKDNVKEMTNSNGGVDSCPKRNWMAAMNSIDVDAMNFNGQTPLHLCIKNGHNDTYSLLLQLGCDIATLECGEKIPFDNEKELSSELIGMHKEKKASLITKFDRGKANSLYAEVSEATVANLLEVLDDKNTIEGKETIISENSNIVIEINGNSGVNDNLLASGIILDGKGVVQEYKEKVISNGKNRIDKMFVEIEQDSCKSNLSEGLLKNICPGDYSMANTCREKEHWNRLEDCSNPHQKLDFFEKGYRINKEAVRESCNDGNHGLAGTAGECCDINSKAHIFDINHNQLRNTDISSSCSTPTVGNSNSRMNEIHVTSRCATGKFKSKEDMNTRIQKSIAKRCDLENPFKLGDIWRSASAPEIGSGADKSSDLISKQGWCDVRSVDFHVNEIETFNVKTRTDSSCSSAYDGSPASTVNSGNMIVDNGPTSTVCLSYAMLQEIETLDPQSQKAADIPLELVQSFTERNSRNNSLGSTINGDQPNDTCDVMNGVIQSTEITFDSVDSSMFTNEPKANDKTLRSSKNNKNLLKTESSPNSYKGTDKFYVVDTTPVIATTCNTKVVGRSSFQLKLNGEQVETYDRIEDSLCWKDTPLEKYDELNVHEAQVTNQVESTAFGGLNLCSDCLFKRKFKRADAENIGLNFSMGTSQSNNVAPANELWEVWELNNNKNDCKKEWNSPNRTNTKQRQRLTALPSHSRSLPDSIATECNSIMEGILFDSTDCFLTESARKRKGDLDNLRRHSWPDLSALPIFPFKSLSKKDLNANHGNEYNEPHVSFKTPIFNSVENHLRDGGSNQSHFEQTHSPESRSSSGTPPPQGSDSVIYSLSSLNMLISPVHKKPELPYIFCENIYHIRSDSDLRGKYREKYHLRATDDTVLSRSTSCLSQCFLDEDIDYFPCKDDSHLHMNPKHQCYDWNLSIEPPCEYDKNHLTVSMKSKGEDCEHELAYSYICSENEDIDGSFICSDCGTTVPHISINENQDQMARGFVEVEKESKSNDEFVLICVPSRTNGCREETGNKNSGSLNIYHREESARNRRLSGVHGSLENIEETDIEIEYVDVEQDGERLEYDGCKMNGNINIDESKSFKEDGDNEDCMIDNHYSDPRNDNNNLPCEDGMNLCQKDGKNSLDKDGMNPRDKDGTNLREKGGINPSVKDGINLCDKDGLNLRVKDGTNPRDSKKIDMAISDDGSKGSELKQQKHISRQSSKCKLIFSNAECTNLEHEFYDCSCCSKGPSYGCLRCSCDRGISESTSESLISADTGIDIDDACLTDWEEFNQCLNFGSSTGDICTCSRKRRLSSTPVSRKVSVDCIRREMNNRNGNQKQDADGNIRGQIFSKFHKDRLDIENLNSRTSKQEEKESLEERCEFDYDLAIAPSIEVSKKGDTIDQEGVISAERVPHRKSKANEFGRGFLALLKKLARQAKHGNRKDHGGFDIKLIVNKDGQDLHVKVFVLNFENEEGLDSLMRTCSNKTYGPANGNKVKLNSALELIIGSKKSKDNNSTVSSCFNFYGKGRKVDINECWLVKSPKILASIIISIAESSEPLEFKVRVANALLFNVCSHSTCPLSSIVNWVLVKLNFIKSESYVHASTKSSATLLLLTKMITEPYFELESLRQLAYIIARPRISKQKEEIARKEFLCTCLRIEINSFAFSCKYAFKIFISVQMLLCGLEDELKTAFQTLDRLLMKYLHEENCLDFVSDILIYLGLLKSEFQVHVTSDYKTCFQLLTHIVRQSYFPLNGVIVLEAFIKKPHQLLYSADLQRSEFELTLQTRIKEDL